MKKFTIEVVYGKELLEELIVKSITREILSMINDTKPNNNYSEINYEYK